MRGNLRRTKLGDVETFWAEGSGPLTAGFTFRVGVIDESIPMRGITHMVEHLALQRLGRQPYTYNGLVDHLRTTFFATGSIVEISDFLRAVCAGIINPPLERLEHERQVLLTEGERHAPSWLDTSLAVRYGPRGPGLSAYEEFGLHRATADDISHWTARHFRAENAVLWLSGPPPEDLSLELPGGDRVSVSPVHPVAMELPAWYELGERGVAGSSVVPRSTAASALSGILEHRLAGELRYARGISYEVGSNYMPLGSDLALQSVWADALKHNTDEARDVMVATLEDLKANGPSEEDVARFRADLERAWSNPGAVPGILDAVSLTYLLKPEDAERDVLGEARALQPAEVRDAAGRFAAGAIFVVPQGSKMPRGHTAVPQWSKTKVRGKTFRPSRRTQAALTHHRLVQGDSGVTLVQDRGRFVSVAYESCEGVIQWSDGSRLLLGSDGFMIHVQPKDWRNGKRIVDGIDRQLSDRAVLMRTDPPAYTASGWDRGTYLRWALISGFFALGAIANLFDPEHQSDGSWPFYVIMLLLLLPITLFTAWKYFLLRRRH